MDFWQQITKNLKDLISASPKSKMQISNEIGVTPSSISNFISGLSYPSLETLKKLCIALDCNYEDILGRLE